jgi:peptide/nickel transport system substrate-binding protein
VGQRVGLVRIAALAAAVGLLVAACGGGDDDGGGEEGTRASDGTTPSTVAPDEAQQGGHLDVLLPVTATQSTTLDPARLSYKSGGGGAAWYPWAIYGGLLVEDPLSGTIEPSLAESIETTDDGTTWELTLREGLTFSDGTPLDAEAVKSNWDRVADPATGALAQRAIATWESWEVTDPLTVAITLQQPNPQLPRLIAQSFSAIGSPTAIEEMGDDFSTQPVGAGPFVVDDFQPGTSLSVSKNADYFDAPRPYLDSITFRAIADEDQKYRSYEAGEADLAIMLRPSDVARVDELDSHAVVTNAAMFSGYAMNTTAEPFDDIRVRRAFVLATDRSIVCQARNAGQACGDGSVPVPDWPFPPGTPLHDPDVTFPDTNVDEAQQLIDDYLAEGDSDSVDVTLTTVAGAQIALDIAQALKSQLDQLDGVDVTIEQAGADFATHLAAGDYEMTVFSISDAYPYPTLHEWFHSGGTLNAVTGYTSDEFDDLLDTALAAETPEDAAEPYNAFAQALIDRALLIPYSYTQYGLVGRNSVQDIVPHADQGVRWDLLWLDQGS